MADDEPFEPAGQFCPDCTCNNLLSATRCEVCGAPLRGRKAPLPHRSGPSAPEPGDWTPSADDADDDAVGPLSVVLSDPRESLGYFLTDYEADLAAGLLRAQGIAVEVAPPVSWGGPRARELWTNRDDAAQARQILAEVAGGYSPRER